MTTTKCVNSGEEIDAVVVLSRVVVAECAMKAQGRWDEMGYQLQ
jgi:hypothetical protein